MTVSGVGFQTSNLQVLRAQSAFQSARKIQEEPIKDIEKDVKVSISSKEINFEPVRQSEPVETKNPYINEIKAFAEKYNTADIEEDDIQEALKYGTSLFADYTA